MYGFHNQPTVLLPDWARLLTNHYWRIRNESRNKAKRRRYYRYIAKEKLRLAESGIDQELINATCRYLASFNIVSANKLEHLLRTEPLQLTFDFSDFY